MVFCSDLLDFLLPNADACSKEDQIFSFETAMRVGGNYSMLGPGFNVNFDSICEVTYAPSWDPIALMRTCQPYRCLVRVKPGRSR